MGSPSRTVERLHLRAGSESAVRRALPALEDAFRTASLPDPGARLIVVRRLHLGRLPRRASAQTLSVLLESRFQESAWRFVHGAEARDDAEAVWFRDSLEAHELAAARLAGGEPVDAWFWPLAVPALARAIASADRLRAIAFALAEREEAPAALPAWVGSLVRAGYGAKLIAALQPGDGTSLERAAAVWRGTSVGMRPAAAPPGVRSAGNPAGRGAQSPRPAAAAARGAAFTVTGPDDRAGFVEQMVRGTGPSRRDAPSRGTRHRASPDASPLQGRSRPGGSPQPTASASKRHIPGAGDGPIAAPATSPPLPRTRVNPDAAVTSTRTAGPAAAERRARAQERGAAPPPAGIAGRMPARRNRLQETGHPLDFADARPTAAGGLLFLVPALERLGFGASCAERRAGGTPPDVIAGEIFDLLLTRLRIAADDPSARLATCLRRSRPGTKLQGQESVAADWLTACRRLLRRRARIGLASLVCRPARLAITATHLHVLFPLNAAEVRVRRAGLDIDPGWVPWLRHVVTFHYRQELR